MENKHVEKPSLIWELSSHQHWTASLTLILLFLSLLSYLLLGGFFSHSLISGTFFWTILDMSVFGLSMLFSVSLCVVSGEVYAFAQEEQWRGGRKLARWGFVVGMIGVFLVVGVFVATTLIAHHTLTF